MQQPWVGKLLVCCRLVVDVGLLTEVCGAIFDVCDVGWCCLAVGWGLLSGLTQLSEFGVDWMVFVVCGVGLLLDWLHRMLVGVWLVAGAIKWLTAWVVVGAVRWLVVVMDAVIWRMLPYASFSRKSPPWKFNDPTWAVATFGVPVLVAGFICMAFALCLSTPNSCCRVECEDMASTGLVGSAGLCLSVCSCLMLVFLIVLTCMAFALTCTCLKLVFLIVLTCMAFALTFVCFYALVASML
ncbi:hypothetical protein U1Q18_001817 [Sarracenia purpurea var. burkii]